jgi:hypothetical protein
MLAGANFEIHRATQAALRRRLEIETRRAALRRSDVYLVTVEDLVEDGRPVPEQLMAEIGTFLRRQSRKLGRLHRANAMADPVRVLELLFDAQDRILGTLGAPPMPRQLLAGAATS